MAVMIRIDPAALIRAAERNSKVNEVVEETTARMTHLINKLNSSWDGGASEQALDSLREIREQAQKLGQFTGESGSMLRNIAEAFRSLDEGVGAQPIPIVAFAGMVKGALKKLPGFILRLNTSLRIEPDEVREVGRECEELAKIYDVNANDLKKSLSELMEDWEGRSAAKYADDTLEIIEGFQEMAEVLDNYANKLYVAADRYEELDNMLFR